jgi:hypothetical protein
MTLEATSDPRSDVCAVAQSSEARYADIDSDRRAGRYRMLDFVDC